MDEISFLTVLVIGNWETGETPEEWTGDLG